MAGIIASSVSHVMEAADTDPTNTQSGYVSNEQVSLSTTPTGSSYQWALAKPTTSTVRCRLSSTTDASPTLTPDVAGEYVVTCVVDTTTVYSVVLSVVQVAASTVLEALRLLPVDAEAVVAPATGSALFHDLDENIPRLKYPDGTLFDVGGPVASLPNEVTLGQTTNANCQFLFGPLYIDAATPNTGSLYAALNYENAILQAGDDDLIFSGGINYGIGGTRLNTTRAAIAWQFENYYVPVSGMEMHFGEYRSADGNSSNSRRWLSAAINTTTHAIQGGAAGLWQWFNSARSQENGRMTETGEFQVRDKVYVTVGGNKTLLQLEQNTPGSTWAVMTSTSSDRAAISLDRQGASDGDVRFGAAADLKCKIGSNTRSILNFANGIANLFENHLDWAGVNFTVPTSGSGISWYLATNQVLQAAFDGLYVAKQGKVSLHGNTPQNQFSTTGQTAGFTAGGGTAVRDDSTFTGGTGTKAYTVGDIVRMLKLRGDIASS